MPCVDINICDALPPFKISFKLIFFAFSLKFITPIKKIIKKLISI